MSTTSRAVLVAAALFLPSAGFAQERIGVAFDLWAEGSTLSGEQRINASRIDESFGYGALGGAANATLLWKIEERLRIGPGLRYFGSYGGGGDRGFQLGFLTEGFALAEYGLRAFEKFDAVFGMRAGLAMLVPGGGLADEIQRLQEEGVGVWSVPRLGWLAGVSVGVRRPIADRLSFRTDLHAQHQQLFLFATDQLIDGLRFRKHWSTSGLRLGILVGVEVAL